MSIRAPLGALRVFVEAARAESFQRAADRLSVTSGAVSRQVRRLEQRLGHRLFIRHAHGVSLDAAGRRLLAAIAEPIDALEAAWDGYADRPLQQSLSISASPAFIDHWLAARIADFAAGDVAVELEASQAFIAPSWLGDRIDLAVRYGRGPWPGCLHRTLFDDRMLPVGAGALCAPDAPRWSVDKLAGRLLFDVQWPARQRLDTRGQLPGWPDWLAIHAPRLDPPPVMRRDHARFDTALAAAAACDGLVLASETIVADRLAAGVLCAPFGDAASLATSFEYALVWPSEQGRPPPVAARFIEWLTATADAFSISVPG